MKKTALMLFAAAAIFGAAGFAEGSTGENTAGVKDVTAANVPLLHLKNGAVMPQFGIGTYHLAEGDESKNSVLWALKDGYRHIDTAHAYRNERSVGEALRMSGIPREEVWITSKLWPSEYGEGKTAPAIEKMLKRLGVDYIDLVYLHQPAGDYVGAWKELEKLLKQGKVHAIGISNFDFNDKLFDDFYAQMTIKPDAMQIECHPYAQRRHWQEKLRSLGIVLECWFPLGGRESHGAILRDPVINRIAQAHGKSAAQIIIRWHIQEGFSVIPGSSNPKHIAENIDVFDFELSPDEMAAIRGLDTEHRFFKMTLEEAQKRFGSSVIDD